MAEYQNGWWQWPVILKKQRAVRENGGQSFEDRLKQTVLHTGTRVKARVAGAAGCRMF